MADVWVDLLARINHSGSQPLSTIADAGTAAAANTGTAIGHVVKLIDVGGGIAGLPGVDGRLLTNIVGIGNGGMTAFVQSADPAAKAVAGDVWIEI
jgi:hypothetical protein